MERTRVFKTMSKWRALYMCWSNECKAELTRDEVMNSQGVCPFCGMDSGNTIVRHSKHSVQFVRNYPRWKFWRTSGRLIYRGVYSEL